MSGTQTNDTVVEKQHGWLRVVTVLTASLTIPGAIVASVIAFQRDLLLGFTISSVGLLVACSIVGMYHLTRLLFRIEENTRRAKAMAPYTMQMSHSITATQNVMQELTTTMQGIAEQMNTVSQDLHEATEKMNAVAKYSRTTAVLLHQQGKLEQAQHMVNGNGIAESPAVHIQADMPSVAHPEASLTDPGSTPAMHHPENAYAPDEQPHLEPAPVEAVEAAEPSHEARPVTEEMPSDEEAGTETEAEAERPIETPVAQPEVEEAPQDAADEEAEPVDVLRAESTKVEPPITQSEVEEAPQDAADEEAEPVDVLRAGSTETEQANETDASATQPEPEIHFAYREVNADHADQQQEEPAEPPQDQEPAERPRRFNLKRLSKTEHM
jgi:hypothetical protein